jgi:hypothetical protein
MGTAVTVAHRAQQPHPPLSEFEAHVMMAGPRHELYSPSEHRTVGTIRRRGEHVCVCVCLQWAHGYVAERPGSSHRL